MPSLSLGTGVRVTYKTLDLISSSKILARLDAGCLWTEVLEEDRRVGAIIAGPSDYAVDAIFETDDGAVGRSFKGQIEGPKLYIGGSDLPAVSRTPSIEELRKHGYETEAAFIEAAGQSLQQYDWRYSGGLNIRTVPGSGEGFLFWKDGLGEQNIIFIDRERTGFITKGEVFLVSDRDCLYVGEKTVMVEGKHGRRILIAKGEIREPRILRDLGPMISDAVHDSLSEFKRSFRLDW